MIKSINGIDAINIELSEKFRKQFRFKIGHCYYNSSTRLNAIINLLQEPNIFYIEGAYHGLQLTSIVAAHAWLEMPNNQIIELTRKDLSNPMKYYPILKFTSHEISIPMAKNHLPLHEHEKYFAKFNHEYSLIANDFYKDRKIIDFP